MKPVKLGAAIAALVLLAAVDDHRPHAGRRPRDARRWRRSRSTAT